MRISDWSSDVCSSDLCRAGGAGVREPRPDDPVAGAARAVLSVALVAVGTGRRRYPGARLPARLARAVALRSEEHTSELQSLMRISYAVFCLKKKTKRV